MPNNFNNPVDSRPGVLNMGEIEPMFERTGPLLDATEFKAQYLFGIPLKSFLTGEEMSEDTLKSYISKAVGDFETSIRIPVSPVRITDHFDFQRADDLQFSTRQLTRFPLVKVEALKALFPGRLDNSSMVPGSDGQEIDYPTSWIVPQGDSGIVRVVPNSGTLVNADISFIASSGYRSILLGGLKQWPNLWRITYIAGFEQDKIPQIVNHTIGVIAAIGLLSILGPVLFPAQSYGIGIDGLSQSVGTAGTQFLATRIADLTAERDRLILQLKAHYGTDFAFSVW